MIIMMISQYNFLFKICFFFLNQIVMFRHVMLPPDISKLVPKTHLMTETEWRNLGVQQSPGWIHYMMHGPEPHILLFRRQVPHKQG